MSRARVDPGLGRVRRGGELEATEEEQAFEGLRRSREGSCEEGTSRVAFVKKAVVNASPRSAGEGNRHGGSQSSLLIDDAVGRARSSVARVEESHIAGEDSMGKDRTVPRRLNMRELKLSSRRWNEEEDSLLIDYVKVPSAWPPLPRSSPPADVHFYPASNKRPGIATGSEAKRFRYETWTPRTMAWVRGVSSSGETVLVPEGQALYAPAFQYVHTDGAYEAWGQERRAQYESSGGTPLSIRNLPPIRTRVPTGVSSPPAAPLRRGLARSVSSPGIDFHDLPYARAPEAGYHPHALSRAASYGALVRAPAAVYETLAHPQAAGYDEALADPSAGGYEAHARAFAGGHDPLARVPSESSIQLFSSAPSDLPEHDMTPRQLWLELRNPPDDPPRQAAAGLDSEADRLAFPGEMDLEDEGTAAEMETGDEGTAEPIEPLQANYQNGVDLVSAHLIDSLSSTYQQYETGLETPLSKERDRLLALESVEAPGPCQSGWETHSLEQAMDVSLTEPPVESLHASNLGSLFPALDAFDVIPSSVKSSQSLPLAVQSPVFGSFDGKPGVSGVNTLPSIPLGEETTPQISGPLKTRAETEEANREGGRRNSSSLSSEGPSETGLAGTFHDILLEGLEEESERKEGVMDETVQDVTLQFEGSSAHVTSPAAHNPALELPVFCDFFKEDLPSIAGLDELETWRDSPFEKPAVKCASDGSCGSSAPVL
ncbi:hypothetical protein KFL_000040240 [Klebsormidium nitens]|uniref:Uncharacterized protein n=1 Tax=Klebsormidium nitens TaxID=105231 RepID=A0A1Y1HJT6_KLENI|nr:hypothetical protein KFL_000040240 [Klebsormidium nitens]|eukprot:GAQ77822.1 hypothetical protein KFL_000040240 [Klebsormidium nitens]